MLERHSALEDLEAPARGAPAAGGAVLAERPVAAAVLIVGWDDSVAARVEAALGALGLDAVAPPGPGTARGDGRSLVAWLGPRRWLAATGDPGAAPRLYAAVAPAHRIECSCARSWLRLSGPAATELLAPELPLDIRAPGFAPGAAAQTLLGQVDVLVHAHAPAPEPAYDLLVGRSLALHAVRDLLDAAAVAGHGLRVVRAREAGA